MTEQEKISEFIDWAIANVQAIADIKDAPRDDVWDAIDAWRKFLPRSFEVEVEKRYYRLSGDTVRDFGKIVVSSAINEFDAIVVVDQMIADGLQTIDPRIVWGLSGEVEEGWIYEDFSFKTTGEVDV